MSFTSSPGKWGDGRVPALRARDVAPDVPRFLDHEISVQDTAEERSRFRFVNASHKAALVRDLLVEIGYEGVELMHTNPGYVPAVYEVTLSPTYSPVW